MKINIRGCSDNYLFVMVTDGTTTIDLGMLDRFEVANLREELNSVLEDLDWFLHVTDQ